MPMLFKTHLVTDEELEGCQGTFEALLKQCYLPGCKPEKLHTDGGSAFSIRTSKQSRIIFTYFNHAGERHPLILGIAQEHNYHDFMKKSLYADYLKNHEDEFKHIIDAFNEQHPSETNNNNNNNTIGKMVRKQVHIIGKQAIIMDENQQRIDAPAIAEGPPGSGKTCIAYARFEKYVQEKEKGKKILYVTQSKKLADHVRAQWMQSPLYDETKTDEVVICSYDELLERFYPGLKFEGQAKSNITDWLLNTPGMIGNKLKKNERIIRAEKMYQEFRIISGYATEEEYLKAGDKKTLFTKDQRPEILKAYQLWKEQNKNRYYQEFHPLIPNNDADMFDKVEVDEGQDFSHLQLRNLMRLAKNKNIIYFIDPKQSLNDDISKILFLQDLFYDEGKGLVIEPIKLNVCYRCPPLIMELAKKVNELRIALTPRGKHEAPIQVNAQLEGGNISWLDTTKRTSFDLIEIMKHDSDVCIVTDEANQKKLMAQPYSFSRVFTTQEIKGLQYKTVVLYEMLTQDIFYQINAELSSETTQNREDNVQFSSPLCSLFTAITRAENQIIFYQTESPRLKNIIDPLKAKQNQHNITVQKTPIDRSKKLTEAHDLYQQGLTIQAEAILRNEVFEGEQNREQLIQEKISSWIKPALAPDSSSSSSSSSGSEVSNDAQTLSQKSVEILNSVDISRTINHPNQNHKNTLMFHMIHICDWDRLHILLNHQDRDKIDWNYQLINNSSVLEYICIRFMDTQLKMNQTKSHRQKITDKVVEIVRILIHDIKVDLHPSSGTEKGKKHILFNIMKSNSISLALRFLESERLNLGKIFNELNDSEKREFKGNIIYCYSLTDGSAHENVIDYFEQNDPAVLHDLAIAGGAPTRPQDVALIERAAKRGHVESKKLLSKISTKQSRQTPLMELCRTRPRTYLLDIIKLVDEEKVDLYAKDERGYSAFVFACLRPDTYLTNLFFTCGRFDLEKAYSEAPENAQGLIMKTLQTPMITPLVCKYYPDFAKKHGIRDFTFDMVNELEKIHVDLSNKMNNK